MNSKDAKKWRVAMDSEFKALQQNHIWDLVEFPAGGRAIKGHWVCVRKHDGRNKAQWVARGFEQQYGMDYDQTFGSVVRAFRTIFAIAAINGWDIQ
jgi:hypothetical protein